MKKTLFLLLFASTIIYSQKEGGVIATAVTTTHLAENNELKAIAKVQKEIALFQTAISLAEADIYKTKREIYKGLSKADVIFQDVKIVKRCVKEVKLIKNYLKQSLIIAKDNPKILLELNKAKLEFILKTGYFINDTYIALHSSDLKLMNSKERDRKSVV